MRIAIGIAAVLLAGACGKKSDDARTKQCEQLWKQMAGAADQMSKAFGKDLGDMAGAAKGPFMQQCKSVTEDLLPCLADPAATGCAEKVRAAKKKQAGPAPELTWKTVEVDHGRVTARVPDGWTQEDFMGDKFSPPDDADLGFFTELTIGSTCGGSCETLPAAEWAKRVEADVLGPARAEYAIDQDEALGDTGRLIVAHNKPGSAQPVDTHVIAAWWTDGGEEYKTCKAELDDEIAGALDQFVDACKAVQVKSFASSY